MRTTVEIPDAVLRRAKARAAELKISLRQFIAEAVAEKVGSMQLNARSERLKWAGQLRHLKEETARINALIEEEFGQLGK